MNLPEAAYNRQVQDVLDKECLCIGLSNAVIIQNRMQPFMKLEAVNVCPGPNIAYFKEVVTLQKMVDHIYGRTNIIGNTGRPHMFINELILYVEFWKELLEEARELVDSKKIQYIQRFYENLLQGIGYYRKLAIDYNTEFNWIKGKFEDGLNEIEIRMKEMFCEFLSTTAHAERT